MTQCHTCERRQMLITSRGKIDLCEVHMEDSWKPMARDGRCPGYICSMPYVGGGSTEISSMQSDLLWAVSAIGGYGSVSRPLEPEHFHMLNEGLSLGERWFGRFKRRTGRGIEYEHGAIVVKCADGHQ